MVGSFYFFHFWVPDSGIIRKQSVEIFYDSISDDNREVLKMNEAKVDEIKSFFKEYVDALDWNFATINDTEMQINKIRETIKANQKDWDLSDEEIGFADREFKKVIEGVKERNIITPVECLNDKNKKNLRTVLIETYKTKILPNWMKKI